MIELILNDFETAKGNENPNVASLPFYGFITQQPNETFLFKTNLNSGIAFSGAIQVDLIDCKSNVVQNIDNNFAYQSFIDENGIAQIWFEFGLINVDYSTKQLYLKITDTNNGNIYYSNAFQVTYYNTQLSTRFNFWNVSDTFKQSFRLSNTYDDTIVNERNAKQYTTSKGFKVNYKRITTFLRRYKIDAINNYIIDRLESVFSSDFLFLENNRVVVTDFKINERIGTSNLVACEFISNPQKETSTFGLQIMQPLSILSTNPIQNTTITTFGLGTLSILFNRNIVLNDTTKKIYIYKNNVLFDTITAVTITNNLLEFDNNVSIYDADTYAIKLEKGLIKSVLGEDFEINNLTDFKFDLASAQFLSSDFDSDFLI